MCPNSDQPGKVTVDYSDLSFQATKVGLAVGFLTLGIVLISVFGGLWLDRQFGTKPWLTLILVIASAPVSLGLTVWVAKRVVRQKNPPAAPGRDIKPDKGDTTGE